MEKEFKDTRIKIIAKLQKIKRDPETPAPLVRVVSSEDRGGHAALTLDATGRWRSVYADFKTDIADPSVANLLEEYATIADRDFRGLVVKGAKPEMRKSYLKAMRLTLLRGFIIAMEKALMEIPEEL